MMMISVPGMFANIVADVKKREQPMARHSLGVLERNLLELRDRTEKGDLTALDEFFSLYVFDDPTNSHDDYKRES